MNAKKHPQIRAAEIVLPCADLDETLAFFIEQLAFRVDEISPADAPTTALISGHGLRIQLERGGAFAPGVLRLRCADVALVADGMTTLLAPNGTRIELVPADPPLEIPPNKPSLHIHRINDANAKNARWGTGRAGMRYRDLIPDRQGGRFIASHILIPDGGPVPDYMHFHRVRFQMIYCYRGWVRVVYEDQGKPFVLEPGDCVLQPPEVRHQVLESSPGLEVLEVSCPADHRTLADHALELPTSTRRPERDFGGQRFVHHVARAATWAPSRLAGFSGRTLGFAEATGGLAEARVLVREGEGTPGSMRHDAEFLFVFVLDGAVTLRVEGHDRAPLGAGDCFTVPAQQRYELTDFSSDLQILEVALPAKFSY